jgi:hypothetical protein
VRWAEKNVDEGSRSMARWKTSVVNVMGPGAGKAMEKLFVGRDLDFTLRLGLILVSDD